MVAKWLERRHGWGRACGGGVIASIWATIRMKKINKTIIHLGLRRLPIGHGPHKNQPKTGIRDDGYNGEDVGLDGSTWGVLSHCFGDSNEFICKNPT